MKIEKMNVEQEVQRLSQGASERIGRLNGRIIRLKNEINAVESIVKLRELARQLIDLDSEYMEDRAYLLAYERCLELIRKDIK